MEFYNIVSSTLKSNQQYLDRYRDAYNGGRDFVTKYLRRFSDKETTTELETRKEYSYCPAFAKAAVKEIEATMCQAFVNVTREGGSLDYRKAVTGENYGVDAKGSSMDKFIRKNVLPNLEIDAIVAVFVDRAAIGQTKADGNRPPYIYSYTADQIRATKKDDHGRLEKILLHQSMDVTDPTTGLVTMTETRAILLERADGVVYYTINNKDDVEIATGILDLPEIPVVIAELSESLMTDIADYQIALLNLESSDISYALQSNFPFYTEQVNRITAPGHLKGSENPEDQAIEVGQKKGRAYAKGLDRPGFIHPSSEPLQASMAKGEKIKADIRLLLNLTLSSLQPVRASAESKAEDKAGLEHGLAVIASELEYLENEIAKHWAAYEKEGDPAKVTYPKEFDNVDDSTRRARAKDLLDIRPQVPSLTYKKEVTKQVANLTVGSQVTAERLTRIYREIDAAPVIITNPEDIRLDVENGILDRETAADARQYPPGTADKAKAEHVQRLKEIAMAQSAAPADAGARGLDDQDNESGRMEKEESRDRDTDADGSDHTRGAGK